MMPVNNGITVTRRPQQQGWSRRSATVVGLYVVAILNGFPRARAFISTTPCVARGAASGRFFVGRQAAPSWGKSPAVTMSSEGGEASTAEKPQFVPTPEMQKETKTVQPPPDREAAMAMVAAREARDMERGELGAYASADVANLPPPPYYFQVPGEYGNDTLCTDPDWHTALLAMRWLGLPYDVRHEEDEDEAMFVLGDEVYDDPMQLVNSLPERCLLSDFTESLPEAAEPVAELGPAWTELHFNPNDKSVTKLEEKLMKTLREINNVLIKHARKGPFLEGDDVTIGDLALGATTFHMLTAFGLEKQWKVPDDLNNLKKHMMTMHKMQIFKMVIPPASVLAEKYTISK